MYTPGGEGRGKKKTAKKRVGEEGLRFSIRVSEKFLMGK